MKAFSCVVLFLALSLFALGAADQPSGSKAYKNASVEEFDALRADKNSVVLDVRTAREFKAGHIPGAVNMDVNSPDFAKQIAALDKDKTYLVHCASGRRSLTACRAMTKDSFKHLVNLEEGFNAWAKAGKPVEKK